MSRYKLSFPDFGAIWPKIPTDLFGGLRLSEIFPRVPGLQAISALNPVPGHIATAVETAAVPVSRALSPYEIEEIARRIAGEMSKGGRRRKVQSVVDVEVMEAVAEVAQSIKNQRYEGSSKRGRPSKVDHLVQEMGRRAASDELHSTFEEELKYLRAWMKSHLPPQHRPTTKTLYNESAMLKAAYSELKLARNVL